LLVALRDLLLAALDGALAEDFRAWLLQYVPSVWRERRNAHGRWVTPPPPRGRLPLLCLLRFVRGLAEDTKVNGKPLLVKLLDTIATLRAEQVALSNE